MTESIEQWRTRVLRDIDETEAILDRMISGLGSEADCCCDGEDPECPYTD